MDARHIGGEARIDLHVTARGHGHAQPVEPQAFDVRDTAHGRQHDVGAQGIALLQAHVDAGHAIERRAVDIDAAAVDPAGLGEGLEEALAQLCIEKSQRL